MTPDDTRFVLAAYRPGTEDESDPRFQDALKQLENDPALKTWFDEQEALSASLSEKLKEIPIPSRLRSDILAGAKASSGNFPRKKRIWPRILAVAACLAIAGVSVFMWTNRFVPSGPQTLTAFNQDMRAYLEGFFLLDYQSEDLDDVQKWLATKQGYSDFKVPETLAGFTSLGCEVIDWHGKQAYLICFDVDGELVHLFSVPDGAALPDAPTNTLPIAIAQSGEWSTTEWVENDELYFVATLGDANHLKHSLGI